MRITMNAIKGYTTHNALLLRILEVNTGDIIELGAGLSSTPLLHWYCKNKGWKLTTYEDNEDFFKYAKQFQSNFHRVRLVDDWDSIDASKHKGIVFVDHGGKYKNEFNKNYNGSRRGYDVIRFKDSADYIVMHDTEKEEAYGYDKAWEHFKYRYDWRECRPHTSVVSNTKDLAWLNFR